MIYIWNESSAQALKVWCTLFFHLCRDNRCFHRLKTLSFDFLRFHGLFTADCLWTDRDNTNLSMRERE